MNVEKPVTYNKAIEQIRKQVKDIRELAEIPDYEGAHSLEDDLRNYVLELIASGRFGASATFLAREAMVTGGVKFPRWSA